jgi:hypothetical protein
MTDELIENTNIPKIKGKFKIPKILIIVLVVILLISMAAAILWKMGIVAKILAPKPGSCLILTESNCKKITVIKFGNGQAIAVDLPKDAVIFSPVDGVYTSTFQMKLNDSGSEDLDWGFNLTDKDSASTYNFIYFKKNKWTFSPDKSVKKGDQIGTTIELQKLNNFQQYNLVFFVSKKYPDGGNGPDIETLNKIINSIKK